MQTTKAVFVGVLVVALLLFAACGDDTETTTQGDASPSPANGDCEPGAEVTTASGLRYVENECGTGAEAVPGSLVAVHYTGKLENGKVFDSSKGREPLEFQVGAGMMIPGFDEGVEGMREGGNRTLTLPPELAYGKAGAGDAIPPNATLIFDVELVSVRTPNNT